MENQTTTQDPIADKTLELCQTILDHPGFQEHRRQIDAFMADEEAKSQYQSVVEKSEVLNQKQQLGHAISDEEIQEFEQNRDALHQNPVTKGFLEAQQELQRVQDSVNQYLSKTFELGRIPTHDDFSGGCGSGCGCH